MSVIRLLIGDGLAYVTVDESLGDRDRECFSHYLLVSEIAQNLCPVNAAPRNVEWLRWRKARRPGSATYRASQSIGDDGTQQR